MEPYQKKKGGATLSLPGWIFFTEFSRFVTTTKTQKTQFGYRLPMRKQLKLET